MKAYVVWSMPLHVSDAVDSASSAQARFTDQTETRALMRGASFLDRRRMGGPTWGICGAGACLP